MSYPVSKLALVSGVAFVLAACAPLKVPDEITDDGLVRVASRSIGGVYRAPDATFTQYKRVILEPPSITFIGQWAEKHPAIGPREIARLREQSIKLFREEFTREFVKRGPYEYAEEPAADVLLVIPAIEDLNIKVPEDGMEPGNVSFINTRPVTMKVTGDMRDAATGKLVGRVIYFHSDEANPASELKRADRTANSREQSEAYQQWTQLAHEALSVAKTLRPRTASPGDIETR